MKRILCLPLLSLLIACGDETTMTGDYVIPVTLQPTTGNSVTGTGSFVRADSGVVTFTMAIAAAPAGEHGFHLHELDVCGTDGMAAGGHWNPGGVDHGGAGAGHLGDMGNVTVGADGTAEFSYSNSAWTAGDGADTDVEGHSIILHALVDDFGQPTGNAGARIGCGTIPHLAG